jgi:hypothetical protein
MGTLMNEIKILYPHCFTYAYADDLAILCYNILETKEIIELL